MIAVYTQALIDPGSTAPTIGASGAIAGVLGAYALALPSARVLTLIFIIFFVTFVEIPALILLALWFILQFVPALGQVAVGSGGDQGVAYFAHVGGFVFGPAVAGSMLSRMRRRRNRPSLTRLLSRIGSRSRNALLLLGLIFCGFFAVVTHLRDSSTPGCG